MSAPASTTSTSATGAAPVRQAIQAQARAEIIMSLRNGERVMVTILIPALLLIFAMAVRLAPTGRETAIQFLAPGILAAAVMSTGMVSLSIATAYERYYGVLKRLGATPLPRWGLIAAKMLSVLAIEVAQVALVLLLATVFYGWRPAGSLFGALLVLLVGTACFTGLGMLMAGTLRAEATLAGANGLYLLFLLIGGVVLPIDHMPGWLQPVLHLLPPAALSDSLRGALTAQGLPWGSFGLLLMWTLIFLGVAVTTFQWE